MSSVQLLLPWASMALSCTLTGWGRGIQGNSLVFKSSHSDPIHLLTLALISYVIFCVILSRLYVDIEIIIEW